MAEEENLDTQNNELENAKDKKIAELQAEIEKLKKENSYDEIKEKYTKAMEIKDNEILELKNKTDELEAKNDEALDKLGKEVKERLEENEKFKKMEAMVRELENERAEATIDTLVKKGIILGKQKDTAKKLFLQSPDLFDELYADAKPVIDTESKPKARKINNVAKGLDYLVD